MYSKQTISFWFKNEINIFYYMVRLVGNGMPQVGFKSKF